jgi:Fe2+ or Zn2+ uptake regulation protein
MPAVSLTDLQQQIAARERELQALRQELDSRQGHLSELTRRKEELQRQLQQVEEEITTLAAATPTETEQPRPAAPASENQPRLGELVLTMLREADGPRTARQLSEEAQQRGYRSQSQDPVNSVENRLQDFKSRGIVRRAVGQRGYVLVSAADSHGQGQSKTRQSAQTNTRKEAMKPAKVKSVNKNSNGEGPSSSGPDRTGKPDHRERQPRLREVLTGILKNSRKPRSARELSEQIQASGYRTDSEKFVKVVGSMLGKMKNVERVPDKGYRLKKKS